MSAHYFISSLTRTGTKGPNGTYVCQGVRSRAGLQVYLPSDGPEDGRAAAAVQALQREIDLMRDLEHRHIVRHARSAR
jgi:hypothetical protein